MQERPIMTPTGEQRWREACCAYLRALFKGAPPKEIQRLAGELAKHSEWERHAD